jgi:hypothetical protein
VEHVLSGNYVRIQKISYNVGVGAGGGQLHRTSAAAGVHEYVNLRNASKKNMHLLDYLSNFVRRI